MTLQEIMKQVKVGDAIFITKAIDIKWNSMRFYNAPVEPVQYEVTEELKDKQFRIVQTYCPKKVNGFPYSVTRFDYHSSDLKCFHTKEEAEIWKLINWGNVEQMIEDHFREKLEKARKRVAKVGQSERLSAYAEKYPEKVVKVM